MTFSMTSPMVSFWAFALSYSRMAWEPMLLVHDDDGVLERHQTTLTVRQAAVIEYLQQDVEDVGVSLLHLIEQDDGCTDDDARLR